MSNWLRFALALTVILVAYLFGASFHKRPHRGAKLEVGLTIILPRIKGAINDNVTQRSILRTICHSGYTRSIRPPISYTQHLKVKQIRSLHYKDQNIKDYEEDHLIPLELGGNPTSPNNLWPEPWAQAHQSDLLENDLNRMVCDHQLTLAGARAEIKQYKFVKG